MDKVHKKMEYYASKLQSWGVRRSRTILTIVLDSLNLKLWVLKSFETLGNTKQGHNVMSQKKGVFNIFCQITFKIFQVQTQIFFEMHQTLLESGTWSQAYNLYLTVRTRYCSALCVLNQRFSNLCGEAPKPYMTLVS